MYPYSTVQTAARTFPNEVEIGWLVSRRIAPTSELYGMVRYQPYLDLELSAALLLSLLMLDGMAYRFMF